MNAATVTQHVPPAIEPEFTLTPAQWGMVSFLVSEVAFFSTLIVAYVTFMGTDTHGPTPATALSLPLVIFTSICLISSSVVIHYAEHALKHDQHNKFCLLWGATIALGVIFLLGTAYEWYELITKHHLTISSNLFGTTYYTLIGFHGLHVTAGLVAMSILLALALRRQVTKQHRTGVELVSWYWHFVDAVWIIVFLIVYVAGTLGGA